MPGSPTPTARRARLAAPATARPKLTLAVSGLVLLLALVVGTPVTGMLKGGGFNDPGSETMRASDQVLRATGVAANSSIAVVVREGRDVTSGAGQAGVRAVVERTLAEAQVAQVLSQFGTEVPGSQATPMTQAPSGATSAAAQSPFISTDRMSAYFVAYVSSHPTGSEDRAKQIAADLEKDPRVVVGGYLIADHQVGDQVSADLGRAEAVAFPILLIVLVLVLRGVVVGMLPVLVGMTSIVTTFLVLRGVNSLTDLSIFALNLVTGLGLGLAIDYGLLIVNRYREEAAVDGYGRPAMVRTMATAGRTVVFSSLTVAGAAGSLAVFPQRFLYSMGIAGVIGTAVAATVALTALPALIVVLGRRIEWLGWYRLDPAREAARETRGFWYRLSGAVMRRPVLVAVATGAFLLALGSPFLRIQFTSVDASVLPPSASARQVNDVVQQDFPHTNASDPIRVVVSAPDAADQRAQTNTSLQRYAASLAVLPTAAGASAPADLGHATWVIDVLPTQPALSDATQRLLTDVRSTPAPYPVLVTGSAADFKDLQSSLGSHLPAAIAIVAGLTVLVLFVMTGSVVLPLKAVLMNALSLSAAFGALVLIFQDGRLEWLLRYRSQGALESTQPILLFAIAFGLSTDYGVFLLQRIKEAHDAGLPTVPAVAQGLQRTGRIVTAAAFLFCIAIGAFASSNIVFIKEVGVGTALAVIIDATVVRALLVPSLMALLGSLNWWAPRPLRALHRRLRLDRLEGGTAAPLPTSS